MNRLLKFEYRKLFHSVSFYICGGITILLALINVYTISAQESLLADFMIHFDNSGAGMMLAASGNISYTLLFPIAISIFLCSDFQEGTIRNIIGRGYSRTQVFFAKLISAATIAAIYYLAGVFVSTIYGIILWGFGSIAVVDLLSILVQLISLIAFSAMYALLSILFRKIGGALTIGIFADIVFSAILNIIDLTRNVSSLASSLADGDISIALDSAEETFEFADILLSTQISKIAQLGCEASDLLIPLLVALGYGILFTVLGFLFFRKREF